MRLLYIWVEEYQCFENQGFNFSSKFKFEYNKDNKILKVKENEDYIKGLFNDFDNEGYGVTEVTTIVGKNGSGKSTLLNFLTNLSKENLGLDLKKEDGKEDKKKNKEEDKNYLIVILNDNNEINIFSTFNDYKNVNLGALDKCRYIYPLNDLEYQHYEKNINLEKLDKCIYIYHSNTLEYQFYKKDDNLKKIYDISTAGLMREDNKKLIKSYRTSLNSNEIVVFFNEELNRQIEFVYGVNDIDKYIDFKMPNKLNAIFINKINIKDQKNKICKFIDREYKNNKKDTTNNQNIRKKLVNNLDRIDKKLNEIKCEGNVSKFKESLIIGIYFNILDSIMPNVVGYSTTAKYENINNVIESNIVKKIDGINTIEGFWEIIEVFLVALKQINNLDVSMDELDGYYNSLIEYRQNIDEIFIDNIKYDSYFETFNLDVDINAKDNEIQKAKNFYKLYAKTALNFNYIKFEWQMSNGENNLLSLFSRFYSLIDKETNKIHCIYGEKDKDDRLMILMDEADMSFHPEWQRKFINLITEFINKFYSEYRVHLIITTHSPIILSDIPSDNIIYLSEGENTSNKEDINNRTFAANIYNLYKERFFWDGYDNDKHFGIIGEFALSKINYVMETLDEYKNFKYPYKYHEEEKNKYIIKLKNCQKIINLIGEPLIRDILDNKYKIAQKELDLKENEDSQIDEIIKNFDKLSGEDRKKFLKHLIDKYK